MSDAFDEAVRERFFAGEERRLQGGRVPLELEPKPPATPYLTLDDLAAAVAAGLAVVGWIGRIVVDVVRRRWPWAG